MLIAPPYRGWWLLPIGSHPQFDAAARKS